MASRKTKVVEYLWETLSAEGKRLVTGEDLAAAIKHCNEHFGTGLKEGGNPYNFMKDLLRGMNANANWPASLIAQRITGRQAMGEGNVLEFFDFPEGQETPFINPFEPSEELEIEDLQSISIPLATKTLGRNDESWLIQVAVNLKVIEHHLSTRSALDFRELTHLQVAVKLGQAEVDALFWGVVKPPLGDLANVVVTCEAKLAKDPIIEDQIVRQIRATFKSLASMNLALVVPMAIKSVSGGRIYVVEFDPWTREDADDPANTSLSVASRALYQLLPPVPGVGVTPAAMKRWSRKPAI